MTLYLAADNTIQINVTFVCTFLPCTHQRPKHCIDKEKGRRKRKRKSSVLTDTIWWAEMISAGFDFLNYNSLIIIQKYLKGLNVNIVFTPGSPCFGK